METKIKSYFEKLNPIKLGLKSKVFVQKVERLGQGTSNLNYLVFANNRKFVLRINADSKSKNKSRKEFEGLCIIQDLKIGPIPRFFSENKKIFGADFLIVDYIEGETVDKTKIYLKDSMIKGIAKLLAEMHSIKITSKMKKGLKMNSHNKDTILREVTDEYLGYIRKYIKNKEFFEMIEESMRRVEKTLGNYHFSGEIVLSQGDFCEQNILYHKDKFKLIDFEDVELTDPIPQIAHTVIDFGRPFNVAQRKLFFREYLKVKKIDNLSEKVDYFIPTLYILVFLWAVQHTLKVRNKEFSEEYLKGNNISRDLGYVEIMFKRNIRAGVIDEKYSKINLRKILELYPNHINS